MVSLGAQRFFSVDGDQERKTWALTRLGSRRRRALILMIKVVRVDKGQEEDLNLALILVIRPFEPAGPFDRARVREGEEPHSLMVTVEGAGETLCACPWWPDGASWY